MWSSVLAAQLSRLLDQVIILLSELVLCTGGLGLLMLSTTSRTVSRRVLILIIRAPRANNPIDEVHYVVDIVVELFRETDKLLREFCREVEGALVEKIIEVLLRDLIKVNPDAVLVTILLIFVIRTVVVLINRLDEAVLVSGSCDLIVLVLVLVVALIVFIFVLLFIVLGLRTWVALTLT